MKLTAIALVPLALAACATSSTADSGPPPAPEPRAADPMELSAAPLAYARIGETVYVDGPRVTPLQVLEDSRCPEKVMCVWAGRVRIKAQIHLGSGDEVREMTMGEPIQIADGKLLLMQVLPRKISPFPAPTSGDYQFGFRFQGGL